MSVYKRGNVYWYEFIFDKQRIQKSTKQGNRRVARQMEADYRTKLAKGEVGLAKPKAAPALRDFAQRFIGYIEVRCAAKPNTVSFYARKLAQILKLEALAAARLDRMCPSCEIASAASMAARASGRRPRCCSEKAR